MVSTATRHSLGYPQKVVDEIFAEVRTWTGPSTIGASLLSQVVGRAWKVEGGWMISGKWSYGSGAADACWATVGVEYEDEHGHPAEPSRSCLVTSTACSTTGT